MTFGRTPRRILSENRFFICNQSALVYEDANGNGQFDMAGSPVPYCLCSGTSGASPQIVSVIYTSPITDLRTAMSAGMYGLSAGWSPMTVAMMCPYSCPRPNETTGYRCKLCVGIATVKWRLIPWGLEQSFFIVICSPAHVIHRFSIDCPSATGTLPSPLGGRSRIGYFSPLDVLSFLG